MTYLALQGLRKSYGSATVLRDVSLNIAAGELMCLLGPSGCGKTTLLNLVAGFLRPDAGQILLRGQPVQTLPPRLRGIGMVFQSYALFPHMTVLDNVAFGLEVKRRPPAQRRVAASRMLERVGLAGFGARYPRDLSGGQQQRVALARALLIEPALLLLDEPFSSLDAALRAELREEVRAIQQRSGVSTLFVTHDREEAMAMSDRVAVMQAGAIEQVDTPLALYRRPRTAFVATFLGEANILQGQNSEFCVRPERVRLGPPGQGRVDGTILRHSFLGARNRAVVATSSGDMIVSSTDSASPIAGTAVSLDWDAADAWAFAPDLTGPAPPMAPIRSREPAHG